MIKQNAQKGGPAGKKEGSAPATTAAAAEDDDDDDDEDDDHDDDEVSRHDTLCLRRTVFAHMLVHLC